MAWRRACWSHQLLAQRSNPLKSISARHLLIPKYISQCIDQNESWILKQRCGIEVDITAINKQAHGSGSYFFAAFQALSPRTWRSSLLHISLIIIEENSVSCLSFGPFARQSCQLLLTPPVVFACVCLFFRYNTATWDHVSIFWGTLV